MKNEELKNKLSTLQYKVTQENGTEPPFENEYWNNEKEGIYVDIVSGEPLFSSKDKYKSGTGWPSFTKPIKEENISFKEDKTLFLKRTEVKSKKAGSHLGHVFEDGSPTGKRYCINSASLRFVHVNKMEEEGYGEFLKNFKQIEIKKEVATFAAGCFWGVQEIFNNLPGVLKTNVGYTGGKFENPKYTDVSTGRTGHAEAIQIEYDANIITYEKLLSYFWRLHNPTTLNRQGPDIGTQYRSAIFYHNEEQRKIALKSKEDFEKSDVFKNPVVTEIVIASVFYDAEEYHQNYFEKKGGVNCHILRNK